jgi:hypothetical protein
VVSSLESRFIILFFVISYKGLLSSFASLRSSILDLSRLVFCVGCRSVESCMTRVEKKTIGVIVY